MLWLLCIPWFIAAVLLVHNYKLTRAWDGALETIETWEKAAEIRKKIIAMQKEDIAYLTELNKDLTYRLKELQK